LIEFHHRNPDEKEDEVSFLVSSGYSIERIKKEMAKCATLCPNCHRLHHWNEKIETGKSVYSKSATKRKPLGNHKSNTAKRKRKQRERNARKKAKSDKKN